MRRPIEKAIDKWAQENNNNLSDLTESDQRSADAKTWRPAPQEFGTTVTPDRVQETTVPEPNKKRVNLKRVCFLLFVFTLPTVATLLVDLLYQLINRLVRIKWYIPAGLLFADLMVACIQPGAAVLAGPGYIWYQVFNYAYHLLLHGWVSFRHTVLHGSYNVVGANLPLFYHTQVYGNAVYLYFQLTQAVASSVFWATLVVCTKGLIKSLRRRSVPGQNTAVNEENAPVHR